MANNTGLNPQTPRPEQRLFLALMLVMLVLLVSQYFFKPAPGPKPAQPMNDKNAAALASKPTEPPISLPTQAVNPNIGANHIGATSEMTTDVDTALYHLVFTNRGAALKSWVMKRFRNNAGKPLELINTEAKNVPLPFTVEIDNRKLTFDPNNVLYQPEVWPDGTGVSYEYSDGTTTIKKSFLFKQDSYLGDVQSSIVENGQPVPHLLVWRGGFGDQKVRNAAAIEHSVRYDTTAGKLIKKTAKDAKKGPVTDTGSDAFAGLEDKFFAAVALPNDSTPLELRTYGDELKVPGEDKSDNYVGVGISTGSQNAFSLYVGPKDTDVLRKVNPKLTQIIDWGYLGVIAKPLFLWLNWVNDHWTFNYGWAIILVTLIINIALFPFKLTSLKSARKMQKLQPQIQAINAKYKDISLRDPKKAEQNQEVMALYKREGVNPLGGCLPMLLQLPFFYAFYRVLDNAIELRHAPWMWVPDLSSAETLPLHLLPLILVATQFLSQKLTPAAGVDPNQQRMMMFMPLMFGFMFYYASAGLVLYWLTGNIVGILQQLIINRFMPTATPPPVAIKPSAPASSKAPAKRVVKK